MTEAAKNSALPHCCQVPNYEDAPTRTELLLSLTGVGMSLDQVKYTYPCLPAFIMTQQWLKQPKMLPCLSVVECQTMSAKP